jgi:DNA (cytosine-5)-methyltransferase 1
MGMKSNEKGVSLSVAATAVGVSAITLRRWLLEGKVAEVSRNRNGWRIFMRDDIERIKTYAERLVLPENDQ